MLEGTENLEINWFYENKGERIGPVAEQSIVELVNNGILSYGALVWKKGLPDWIKIENSELREHVEDIAPPPLTGSHVNNTIVWILAFAPIIGLIMEAIVAGIKYKGNEFLIEKSLMNSEFWYITLILTISLSLWDEKRLEKCGVNVEKFSGWVWLVPVYLFQRAKHLKHNYAYFIVWIISLSLVIIDF